MLRGQDILIALKIHSSGVMTYEALGRELQLSASQAHASIKRGIASSILRSDRNVRRKDLFASLLALKYFMPGECGGMVRGVATSYATSPLNEFFSEGREPMLCWPYEKGQHRGMALAPIYKTAPQAALADPFLYELLALIDAIRTGRSREVTMAEELLRERIIERNENLTSNH